MKRRNKKRMKETITLKNLEKKISYNKSEIVKVNLFRVFDTFFATSEQLKGLNVAHRDIFIFIKEIPNVIKNIYKAKYNKDFIVKQLLNDDIGDKKLDGIFSIKYIITE